MTRAAIVRFLTVLLLYQVVPALAQQEHQDAQSAKDRAEDVERETQRSVRIKYLSADEMVDRLKALTPKGARLSSEIATNSLKIVGSKPVIDELTRSINDLDQPVQRLFVYPLKNAKAGELSNTLCAMFKGGDITVRQPDSEGKFTSTDVQLSCQPEKKDASATGNPSSSPIGELVGDVAIVPDRAANTLIIRTTPRNYQIIEATLQRLDVAPKQVIIEALLAEVTLSDTFNFSLEEMFKSGTFALSAAFGAGTASVTAVQAIQAFTMPTVNPPPSGFTFTYVDGTKFRQVLNSLAGVTKVRILATPYLLTANNRVAKLLIGQIVPVVKADQSSVATQILTFTTTPQIVRTFVEKEIGIKLNIRPFIAEDGVVTLDIEVSNTSVLERSFGDTGSPSFSNTSSVTSVAVQGGQSIVISGIIQNRAERATTGIPFLSSIPVLGYLFRRTADRDEKTELLILVTPHIVARTEEGKALTERFRQRAKEVNDQLKAYQELLPSAPKP